MSSDFDGFYHAHYGNTVAMVYGFTGELAEAQDIAQEAFCRAWQRWGYVAGYDNPAAWVRRVATNLAHSRWKRARRAAAGLLRMRHRPLDAQPVDPEHIAVVAALRKLPLPQQKALVLHHIVDLPIEEVAEHLDAPVGTVKSWLHRGRGALASELRLELPDQIAAPPTDAIADRARRRAAARRAGWAAAMLLVLAGLIAAFGLLPRGKDVPVIPGPIVSPSPVPSSISTLSMADSTVQLQGYCGQQNRVSFSEGKAGDAWISQARVLDVTGDGRPEALVQLNCNPPTLIYISPAYLVLAFEADGSFREIGKLPGPLVFANGLALHVDVGRERTLNYPGKTAVMRWNGGSFDRSDWEGYPQIEILGLTAFADRLRCQGLSAPASVRVPFGLEGKVDTGDLTWRLEGGKWIPLPDKYLYLTEVHCGQDKNLVLVSRTADEWVVASIFPRRSEAELFLREQDGDIFVVGTRDYTETYRWTGEDLVLISR